MNKADLIAKVSEHAGVDAGTAEKVAAALFTTLTDVAKAGDKVTWPGFGTFSGASKAARTGRNPATGATINIPASKVCKFSQAAGLKAALNS
jgi:DNA-binding protein HU-beta